MPLDEEPHPLLVVVGTPLVIAAVFKAVLSEDVECDGRFLQRLGEFSLAGSGEWLRAASHLR